MRVNGPPEGSRQHGRPIEEWTDDELIDQYRYLQAELGDEDPSYLWSDDNPLAAIEAEIESRGLERWGESVEPDAASAGREERDQLEEG